MRAVLQRLSQYWQLRFIVVAGGALLIIYAVVMPVHSNVYRRDAANVRTVQNSNEKAVEEPTPIKSDADTSGQAAKSYGSGGAKSWFPKNQAVAIQLKRTADWSLDRALPRDFSDAIRVLRRDADGGNPVAEFLYGHAYQRGLGVRKDMAACLLWYGKAQSQWSEQAGENDLSNPKSFEEALRAYRRLAEEGDATAQLYMGYSYDLGEDVPRSGAEAARLYRRAAKQGSASAANNLGVLSYSGVGTAKSSEEAVAWFRTAAARGSVSGEYNLGRMYYVGEGVPADRKLAAEWIEKAARQGNTPAQVLLSAMYANGDGVPGNIATAYMWINLASSTDIQAKESRDFIEGEMPRAEIAEGQMLTRDWLSRRSGNTTSH
jgi:TPR repeat protein